MIQANEIRVGNLIKSDGIIVTVDARIIFDIWDSSKKYDPIELTPEILEKAGFKKTVEIDDFDTWRNRIELWEHDEGFCHSYAFGGDIQSIHQLQNLYFCLTGEELTL